MREKEPPPPPWSQGSGMGCSRGREPRALSTLRTRFILPMWIMKPSVQAMSEGEWPPPTTFTRLFCCLARASTCGGSTCISLSPGLSLRGSWATQALHPQPPRHCLVGGRRMQATPGKSQREGPGSEWGAGQHSSEEPLHTGHQLLARYEACFLGIQGPWIHSKPLHLLAFLFCPLCSANIPTPATEDSDHSSPVLSSSPTALPQLPFELLFILQADSVIIFLHSSA